MTERILITGAGGPAALAFARSVAELDVELFMADMDPLAAGLYEVPPERRVLLPPGNHPGFAETLVELCAAHRIDTLVPTVDVELFPIASARARFAQVGTRVLSSAPAALSAALDKYLLYRLCRAAGLPVPRTALFTRDFDPDGWRFPLVVKPRRGSGSRGVHIVGSRAALDALERSDQLLVQAHLPGEEYSVDVLSPERGLPIASVPRARLKVDSGVAVVSRTVRDVELEALGARVVSMLGLSWINNVQLKRDASGAPRVLEVNPRVPGTLELTVASGVNMPSLALAGLRGGALPDRVAFREIACVRTLQMRVVESDALMKRDDELREAA